MCIVHVVLFIGSVTIRCMTHKHSSALRRTNGIALIRFFGFIWFGLFMSWLAHIQPSKLNAGIIAHLCRTRASNDADCGFLQSFSFGKWVHCYVSLLFWMNTVCVLCGCVYLYPSVPIRWHYTKVNISMILLRLSNFGLVCAIKCGIGFPPFYPDCMGGGAETHTRFFLLLSRQIIGRLFLWAKKAKQTHSRRSIATIKKINEFQPFRIDWMARFMCANLFLFLIFRWNGNALLFPSKEQNKNEQK